MSSVFVFAGGGPGCAGEGLLLLRLGPWILELVRKDLPPAFGGAQHCTGDAFCEASGVILAGLGSRSGHRLMAVRSIAAQGHGLGDGRIGGHDARWLQMQAPFGPSQTYHALVQAHELVVG